MNSVWAISGTRSAEFFLMTGIGVIVEGDYDEVVIPIFLKRLRSGVRVIARQCRGRVTGKFPGLVAEMDRSQRRLEKILVVSDAHGRDPEELDRKFRSRLVKKYRFQVVPIIIVQELEAWLIADPDVLKNIVGVRKNFANPEKLIDPKTQLERLLPRAVVYTSEMAGSTGEGVKAAIAITSSL